MTDIFNIFVVGLVILAGLVAFLENVVPDGQGKIICLSFDCNDK